MAFSPQFLDELRGRLDLAGIIGKRVRLQRKGREHSGLCPFHNEKTPSFTVNEEKGFYHCFGCGEHGSAFDFVMKMDNLSFPEAVERLAAEAGMEVPQSTPEETRRATQAKSQLSIVEAAAVYFEKQLRLPSGKAAMDYLLARGIGEEAIRRFRIGFSLDSRDGLKLALARDGISESELLEAGLLIKPDEAARPSYDRFRGRVMFPISDARGRVIAFGGRILGAGEPKYLNSPETALFHKRLSLYGLAESVEMARERREIVVVEGYTDVIALHQAGLKFAVAPLGTALTEDQMRLLWRFAPEPYLCFDGDAAGGRAALRAAERALPILKPGYGLKFISLPEGTDPDDLIRAGGPQAITDLFPGAPGLSDTLWQMERQGTRLERPEERAGLEQRFRQLTGRIEDEVVRRHYFTSLKDRIWQEYNRSRKASSGAKPWAHSGGKYSNAPASSQLAPRSGASERVNAAGLQEEILMATVITHPEILDRVDDNLGSTSFLSPALDKMRQEVLKAVSNAEGLDSEALKNHLYEAGFGDALDGLLSRRVYDHARFARPDQPSTDAEKGWEQLYRLYRRTQLLEEIRAVEARLKAEPTRETFETLKTLKVQVSTMDEDAGPVEMLRKSKTDTAA